VTSLPEVGERVAQFRILRKIGEGGMGAVFEAEDERLGRRVALKILPPEFVGDPERRARFFREARAAAAVQSRRIATVHEVGEDDRRIYIAMEYVHGDTLRKVIQRGPLELDVALRIARDVAAALDKAHSAGVVHRDLKPENVMLDDEGEAKVLDFGLATALPGTPGMPSDGALPATLAGRVLGTPGYMSPEQARGEPVDARSDCFAFGVLLYELLSGRPAFSGSTAAELLVATLEDEPPSLVEVRPDIPLAVAELLRRCLQKDPERRVQSTAELLSALDRLLDTQRSARAEQVAALSGDPFEDTMRAHPPPELRGDTLPAKSRPEDEPVSSWTTPIRIAGGVVLVLALAGGAWALLRDPHVREPVPQRPLDAPDVVVACPIFEEETAGLPSGWLGAAAGAAVCTDLTTVLGATPARTRIPAELIALPETAVDDFPADPFGRPDARERALGRAREHSAWVEGRVRRVKNQFELTATLHTRVGPLGDGHTVLRDSLHAAASALVDRWIEAGWVRVRAPIPGAASTYGCSDLDCLRKNVFLEQELCTSWELEPTCNELQRRGANARWVAGFDCGALLSPPPVKERDSALHLALDGMNRLGVLSREESRARAEVLAKARPASPEVSNFTSLAEALLRVKAGDLAEARTLADSVIAKDPRDCDARGVAVEAASGQPNKAALVRAEGAWCPWRARAFRERHWDSGPKESLPFERLALALSSDSERFAPMLAYDLLAADRREEARTIASRFLTGTGRRRDTGEYILALVEADEGRLVAATRRLRDSVWVRERLSPRDSVWELELLSAMLFAEVLGRDQALAADFVRRYLLSKPARFERGVLFVVPAQAALRSPRPLALEALGRIRELTLDGTFVGAGMGAAEYLDGCEAFVRGDMKSAVASWRSLAAVPGYFYALRPEAFDAVGEKDLAWKIDGYRVGRSYRTELAHVRQAQRAAAKGDVAEARRLARRVVDKWSTADAEIDHVKAMRDLLARLPTR